MDNIAGRASLLPSKRLIGSSYGTGLFLCLVATVSWGLMFPVMTSALRLIDPFTFTSLRYLIAGMPFLAVLLTKEGFRGLAVSRRHLLIAWIFGTIGFAGFGFLAFLGQQMAGREGALTASIMMATQPMMGLLLNSAVRRILPARFTFLFILMSFCGVVLVITKGDVASLMNAPMHYSAYAFLILGAFSWVVYTFGATYFQSWSPFKYTAITTWLGLTSVFAINLALYATHLVAVPTAGALIAIVPHLLYMGLIAGFVAVLFWNMGNKILTPMNGVLFMDVVPLVTFAVSFLTGVIASKMQLVGACMTGVALILNNAYLRKKGKAKAIANAAG